MRLTREQRAALFAGQAPRIAGEGKCPVEQGRLYTLSKHLWLEVTAVRRTNKGGWSLGYTIHDHRDPAKLVRRVPPDPRKMLKVEEVSPKVLSDAGRDSSYTAASFSAVAGAGEAPSEATLRQQVKDATERARRLRGARRREQANLDTEARIVAYQREAAHRKIDIRNEVRLIQRLKQQGKPVDSPMLGIRGKLDQDMKRAA